jgi:hypothetical protein
MNWFDALQLALRLIQAIAPVIGTQGVSGHALIEPAVFSDDQKRAIAELHAHVNQGA